MMSDAALLCIVCAGLLAAACALAALFWLAVVRWLEEAEAQSERDDE